VQTAVKTGTSNDYRDAWAVGYSHRFTVGVWMGNVDRREMKEVSGAIGPALVLRAVFAELHRHGENRPLVLDPGLERADICAASGELAGEACPLAVEWFRRGTAPEGRCPLHGNAAPSSHERRAAVARVRLESPTPGLHLALDPRIPDELEAFPFKIAPAEGAKRVEWWVDGSLEASGAVAEHAWPLRRGYHTVQARVWTDGAATPVETQTVGFTVK
jgi:penicillin-binding protein 1C